MKIRLKVFFKRAYALFLYSIFCYNNNGDNMNNYFNNNNKESFKLSIINTLNSKKEEIKGKINDELFKSYINTILVDELSKQSDIDKIFNILVVKFAKYPELFNKYIAPVVGINHDFYLRTIKSLITNNAYTYNYAINNIDLIDYDNPIELEIMSRYGNSIIKSKMFHLKEQQWFIKYIIQYKASENNFRPNVIGYSFSYYIKKRSKNINFKLYKFNRFIKYKNYPVTDPYNNTIYINLGLYKVVSDTKGFDSGLLYLLNSCFKSLSKAIKRNKEFSITYDDEMYRFIKEEIIFKEDSNFYNKNQAYFELNNESSSKMITELLSNPMFESLKILNFTPEDNSYRNSSNYKMVDDYIDKLVYSAPSILDDYPMLQMEYDKKTGKRKSLVDLIKLKHDKVSFFINQVNNFKDIIKNSNDDALISNISSKLKVLENGIPGVIKCHNKMIYKAIKMLEINDFRAILQRLDKTSINDCYDAIIAEKNASIIKLQDNRKRIFQKSTFLQNDEFLSNEYSTAVTYEMIINEYLRKS